MKTNLPNSRVPLARWKRIIRGLVTSTAVLVTLTTLFYAVENWRGTRAWESALTWMETHGGKQGMEESIPPGVPDDENMAMHPGMRCFTFTRPDGIRARRLGGDNPDPQDQAMAARWDAMLAWRRIKPDPFENVYDLWSSEEGSPGPLPDAEEWRKIAHGYQSVLAPWQDLVDSVREALRRPACRWPAMAGGVGRSPLDMLPAGTTYESLIQMTRLLQMEAFVNSTLGVKGHGWEEIACLQRFGEVCRSMSGNIMGTLVGAAAEGTFQAALLRTLEVSPSDASIYLRMEQGMAGQQSAAEKFAKGFEMERSYVFSVYQWLFAQESPSQWLNIVAAGDPRRYGRMVMVYGPGGWVKQDAANQILLYNSQIQALRTPGSQLERIHAAGRELAQVQARKAGPYHFLSRLSAQVYSNIGKSLLMKEARHNLLLTALIIGQHRVANGKSPAGLQELAPELKARIPASPVLGDLPAISRNPEGTLLISYQTEVSDPANADQLQLQVHGW